MKKLYTTPERKEYDYRRLKKIERKQNKKKVILRSKAGQRYQRVPTNDTYNKYARIKHEKKSDRVIVEVPTNFSIINNTEEMLNLFNALHIHIEKRRKIFFEMSNITQMTADAILYMLSVLYYYRKKYGYQKFAGNLPLDSCCRDLLIQSGFLRYFISNVSSTSFEDSKVLAVKSDELVQASIAQEVIDFSTGKLKKMPGGVTKSIYATLIESMANTKQHAYKADRIHRKWWLIAQHDDKNNKVSFVILDNGLGIPHTIKKKYYERILGTADSDLIVSALKGEFRTRTKQGWRGKGLPKIFEYSKEKQIDNLIIISNFGYVNVPYEQTKKLDLKFHGTLLSWDFV